MIVTDHCITIPEIAKDFGISIGSCLYTFLNSFVYETGDTNNREKHEPQPLFLQQTVLLLLYQIAQPGLGARKV